MRLTIIQLSTFDSDWRRLKLDDDDLMALEGMLLEDPECGKVIAGTGGLRKVRFAPPSRHTGKSGAMRVGYAYIPTAQAAYLVIIFSKNQKSDLSASEKKLIKALLERVRNSLDE